MLLNNIFKLIPPLAAVIFLAVSSCNMPEETVTAGELSISVPLKTAGTAASEQFVTVEASGAWTVSLDFGDAEE